MQVNAILFDVQSIQKYIFANNKLKAMLGLRILWTDYLRMYCVKMLS